MPNETDGQQGAEVQLVDTGTAGTLGLSSIDLDCYKFSTEKWPDPQGLCNFDNIDQSGISIETGPDGDDVRVYDSAPIIVGTVVDLDGQPQRVELDYDVEWVNAETDETISSFNTGHDSVQDAGDGRYWTYWGWSFSLDPARDNLGDQIQLEIVVEDKVSGQSAFFSTTFFGTPAKVEVDIDATIDDVRISEG
jgi:hypothetical protein